MATTARSPSPNPSRPRTPDAMRKSYNSVPWSASESHHHHHHRCRSPSPSPRAPAVEHKENEGDLKASATRAVSSSSAKGAKNFMAPTISAASKAVSAAASPRRRILGEKNEASAFSAVRSSLTSLLDESPAPPPPPPPEEVGPAKPPKDSFEMGGEMRTADLDVKNRHSSGALASPADIASSAANPSLPPYDPHTNYLSPRPRFLHYRPSPRIEQYLLDENLLTIAGEGKRLEDSFTSESCEDEPDQIEEKHSSSNMQDNCEESSSSEVEVVGRSISGTSVPESESNSKSSGKSLSFSRYMFASFLLFFVATCISGSLWGYSVVPPSMLETLPDIPTLDQLHVVEYLAESSVNIKELSKRLGHWSLDYFAYYSNVITQPRGNIGPIFLVNLTATIVQQKLRIDYSYGGTMISNEMLSDGGELEQPFEGDVEKHHVDELGQATLYEDGGSAIDLQENIVIKVESAHIDTQQVFQEDSLEELKRAKEIAENAANDVEKGEGIVEHENQVEVVEFTNAQDIHLELVAETNSLVSDDVFVYSSSASQPHNCGLVETDPNETKAGEGIEVVESESKIELELWKGLDAHDHVKHEATGDQYDSAGGEYDIASLFSASPKQDSSAGGEYDIEETPSAAGDEVEFFSTLNLKEQLSAFGSDGNLITGLLSVFLLLVALTVLFLMNQKKNSPVLEKLEKSTGKKVVSKSVSGSSESYGYAKGSPYETVPTDMLLADSGPSEFSSSLQCTASLQTTRKDGEEENLNQKRMHKRDSTASSSSSMSYGSFTTYEKRSAKKGGKDEEVMTPIRRSSRLRSQVVSP